MLLSTQAVPAAVPMTTSAPLLKSAEAKPLRVVYQGLRSLCVAYVIHQGRVVLLSLAGTATVNSGLWAALLSNETLEITEDPSQFVRRVPTAEPGGRTQTLARRKAPSDYKTYRKRLPETGKQHMVIVHRQATGECAMDRDFFVLGEGGAADPPLERFCRQFTHAVACAARPLWSRYLWSEGLAAGLIVPCLAHGLCAWLVSARPEAWQDIVQRGITRKEIS